MWAVRKQQIPYSVDLGEPAVVRMTVPLAQVYDSCQLPLRFDKSIAWAE